MLLLTLALALGAILMTLAAIGAAFVWIGLTIFSR